MRDQIRLTPDATRGHVAGDCKTSGTQARYPSKFPGHENGHIAAPGEGRTPLNMCHTGKHPSTHRFWAAAALVCKMFWGLPAQAAGPVLVSDSFELPAHFEIYKAASPELTGGSYALAFDGQGRLLVGAGTELRRLLDRDNDGVYDGFETLAQGLGPRGPQGLLVVGDRLYAVGGDGIQLYEGYTNGSRLVHRGRIGPKVNTGGDHDAHTIFRGWDHSIYFMAGNGSGVEGTTHITSSNSPVLRAREASVFRFDPDGKNWECVATGGRNPPNLGLNYLAELFSLDSDMEWHVGLPWYRPVRLNHWVIGGDQGWQEVGAYPPYYLDCLPGIYDVGRGSPTWGTFYEHRQFQERYQDAWLVCDYRWKYPTADIYATTGRLLAFFLRPQGSRWTATMEVLARPRPSARDPSGNAIQFALVDVVVAPDGSLFLSDHNQGIWRIFQAPDRSQRPPPINPPHEKRGRSAPEMRAELLSLPQPGAEWSRLREQELRRDLGPALDLAGQALDRSLPLKARLRAIRLVSAALPKLPPGFLDRLAEDGLFEIRSVAAWLAGNVGGRAGSLTASRLLGDAEPFVRRRAAETLTRCDPTPGLDALVGHLTDPDRTVAYVCMTALAHHPLAEWFDAAAARPEVDVKLRSLVAARIRAEPLDETKVLRLIAGLLPLQKSPGQQLDFSRVLGLFQTNILHDSALTARVGKALLDQFPAADPPMFWEQARLLGEFRVEAAFGPLLNRLEQETNFVTQFHLAQAITRLPRGWSAGEEQRLLKWFLANQTGWFAEFSEKGVEFPDFWGTVLAEFGENHTGALLAAPVDLRSQIGSVALKLRARAPDGANDLLNLYRESADLPVRAKIVMALKPLKQPGVTRFAREEYGRAADLSLRSAFLDLLAAHCETAADAEILFEGIAHPDSNTARMCAEKLAALKPAVSESEARTVLTQLLTRRPLFRSLDALLSRLADEPPARLAGNEQDRQRERAQRETFWIDWYQRRFGKPFDRRAAESAIREKPDEEVREVILGSAGQGGDWAIGREVYEKVQCQSCHGGIPGREGRMFGPDLAGVTGRLTRQQLAEAMVYPSRDVPERYRAMLVVTDDDSYTGFITEQNAEAITLSDAAGVHRVPRAQIKSMTPQPTSLMPDHLLNRLTAGEIRDLLAFLEKLGAAR